MERPELVTDPSPVTTTKEEESLKEPLRLGLGDRSKRDEWSEGAVVCLLDAYESKWELRNRAKLKGHDWEDVARQVSSRLNSTKSVKTPTQCKNKIESMKKRYRSESAAGSGSKWPLFPRLDSLVRWRAPAAIPLVLIDGAAALHPQPSGTRSSHSQEPNGVTAAAQGNRADAGGGKEQANETHRETESTTPSCNEKQKMKRTKKMRESRDEREGWEVLASIGWFAEVAVRVEQASMDTMREVQRMRAQADARKGEMDLKCTEIIANSQLQIAKLLAGSNGSVDSSLRIGRG